LLAASSLRAAERDFPISLQGPPMAKAPVGACAATRRASDPSWCRVLGRCRSARRQGNQANWSRVVAIGLNSGLARAHTRAYHGGVQTLPISKVKDRLNELVDAAAVTHERVTITKNGSPAAVLIGADEWESIQETLFWLSQPNIREDLAEARADIASGRIFTEDEIRAEFGVPKRTS
jgi:prevent-host-death family protein